MNSLSYERWYPLVVAVATTALWGYFDAPFPKDSKEFLAAALSYAATLTGFLATAKAILMAMPSDSVMGRLKSSGYLEDLVRYLREAIYFCLVFCALNLAGFFFDTSNTPIAYWYLWVFWGTLSSVLFFRVVAQIMLRILETS